jgi:hypothetical protein
MPAAMDAGGDRVLILGAAGRVGAPLRDRAAPRASAPRGQQTGRARRRPPPQRQAVRPHKLHPQLERGRHEQSNTHEPPPPQDFHTFNTLYRDNPRATVVGFTHASGQIPHTASARYPPCLAGPLYPQGLPIWGEDELEAVVARQGVTRAVLAYRRAGGRAGRAGEGGRAWLGRKLRPPRRRCACRLS